MKLIWKKSLAECEELLKKSFFRKKDGKWIFGEKWSLHPDEVPHQLSLSEEEGAGVVVELIYHKRPLLHNRDKALLKQKYAQFDSEKIAEVATHNASGIGGLFAHLFYGLSSFFMALFGCLLCVSVMLTWVIYSDCSKALSRVTLLTTKVFEVVTPFPDVMWYESMTYSKAFAAALVLSFMMTFAVGSGVAFACWLSENFRVYAKALPVGLLLWPGGLCFLSLYGGSGFMESFLWALASVLALPGYLVVLRWRRVYVAKKPNKHTMFVALLLPFILAGSLFVVVIAAKVYVNGQLGVESALIVRDDVLKKIPLGDKLSDFYYNNVLAANLFVRATDDLPHMEESTRYRYHQNGYHAPPMFGEEKEESYIFRNMLKQHGFALLQYVGIPFLILWFFYGLLALMTGFYKGGVWKIASVVAAILLLLLYGVPLKNYFRDQEALVWYSHRGNMAPLLHELEFYSAQQHRVDNISYLLSWDKEVLKSFNTPTLFEDLNKAVQSSNKAVRAMSLSSFEAFIAIRYHMINVLPLPQRKPPHKLPDSFFDNVRSFYAKHLATLINDEDPVVRYWALHLVVHVDGLEASALEKITEAVKGRLSDPDLNVRDKAVLAMGQIVKIKKDNVDKVWDVLFDLQGAGQWKDATEQSDYIKAHLLGIFVDNWREVLAYKKVKNK